MHAAHADEWDGRHTELGLTSDLDQPSAYHRGVSFDTFNTRDATDFSLTLNYKHKDYVATRRSRTFLCGTDQNDYSDFALEWLIDELVDDGDEIVCLRAVEKDSKIASDSSVDQGRYHQEAEKLLAQVIEKNKHDEKAISLVMELAIGKVQEIIQRMVRILVFGVTCPRQSLITYVDRSKFTNLLYSLSAPVAAASVVCKASFPARSPSTASSNHLSPSSSSDLPPSAKRRRRSAWRTHPVARITRSLN